MNTTFGIGLWGVAAEWRCGRGGYSRALGSSTQSARLRIPLNSFGFGRSHLHAAGQYIGAAITRPIGPRRYWPMPWLQKFPTVATATDRKSTRLNSSHVAISYAVFCLTKKNQATDN